MTPDWLEPSIEKRVDEIFDFLCTNDPQKLYHKFSSAAEKIGDKRISFELENTFLLMIRHCAEYAYRKGLDDMSQLK